MKIIKNLTKKLNYARPLTIGSYLLLAASLIAGGVSTNTPATIIIFSLVPLSLFINTLRKESYKGLALLCFVTLMYFLVTVQNLFSQKNSLFDWVELLAEAILFTAGMMFSRWKQYSLYQDDNE